MMTRSFFITTIALLVFSQTQAADISVKKAARPGSASLKMKSSAVPQFQLTETKTVKGKKVQVPVSNIPRLDIGEEAEIEASDLTQNATTAKVEAYKAQVPAKAVPVKRFALPKGFNQKVKPVAGAKSIIKVGEAAKPPPPAPVYKAVEDPSLKEDKPAQIEINEYSKARMKYLQALIFLEIRKNYGLAMGLLAELSRGKEIKTEVTYQLAMTSLGLGLLSEFRYQMMKVARENDANWQKKAVQQLAQNAIPGDRELIDFLDPKIDQLNIELVKADQYQMNRAKYYSDKQNLTPAFAAIEEVEKDSPLYPDAQFLRAIILYRGGQLEESLKQAKEALKIIEEKKPDAPIRSVAAISLARMQFQRGEYKDAFETYLKVDKRHPEWLQAMVERAWAQILVKDFEGAAGNMFSLHTDFFKKAFQPESFVVRTVGYLNLCQYGDGAKVVYDLKKRYTPVLGKMQSYEKRHKNSTDYYKTLIAFAKNPGQPEVDGLPKELIFYLTRDPKFVIEQEMVNDADTQIKKYDEVSLTIVGLERDLLKKQSDVREKINEAQKVVNTSKDEKRRSEYEGIVRSLDRNLTSYKIEQQIAKDARNAFKPIRTEGINRVEKEQEKYKTAAANALRDKFKGLMGTLKSTLDQGEVLQYELYAGAGEHIRYQMAGGKVDDKEREKLKPKDGKAMNWDFRGEVWEDEIGHFRSSLENVCPPDESR